MYTMEVEIMDQLCIVYHRISLAKSQCIVYLSTKMYFIFRDTIRNKQNKAFTDNIFL